MVCLQINCAAGAVGCSYWISVSAGTLPRPSQACTNCGLPPPIVRIPLCNRLIAERGVDCY